MDFTYWFNNGLAIQLNCFIAITYPESCYSYNDRDLAPRMTIVSENQVPVFLNNLPPICRKRCLFSALARISP